ncbi:PIN domain-containing protein [Chlorogloeopsis sp. ULAP02]|uniref:PIN domain-containing protein n=1 Tax=Chlorogloeopsis sp. ULAP02 TaxID=3107926 RepID=UPI003136D1C8
MVDKVMIDTNLLVYLYAKNPPSKYLKVKEIISDNFELLIVSTQILGELYNVLTKKNLTTKEEAKQIIGEIATNFLVVEIDILKVLAALDINSGYGYSYWDSLVISTALLCNCSILYSEDMQHNQLIENKTRIVNSFAEIK